MIPTRRRSAIAAIAAIGGLVATPGPAPADVIVIPPSAGYPELMTVEACGKTLPATVGDPETFKQFDVDLDAFRAKEATQMTAGLRALCDASPKHRQIVQDSVGSLRFINAQGADEPTPYLGGRVLMIEFAGGDFDAAQFRRALATALDRGSVLRPSFDCTKAHAPVDRLICDDPDLARADAALSETYRQALAAARGDEARLKEMRQSQREWLGARNGHCLPGFDPARAADVPPLVACLAAQYDRRITALGIAAEPAAAKAGPPPADAKGTYRSRDGKLDFDPRADGTASFAIETGNARGICAVPGSTDDRATREGPDLYVFRDRDLGCKVSLHLAGKRISVESEGECYIAYCGVHAPGFDGDYVKQGAAK